MPAALGARFKLRHYRKLDSAPAMNRALRLILLLANVSDASEPFLKYQIGAALKKKCG